MRTLAVFLGRSVAPNMEAYLDVRLRRWEYDRIDIIVFDDCAVPAWIASTDGVRVLRSTATGREGSQIPGQVFRTVRQYLSDHSPASLRQITQPRWHAPGVVAAALPTGTRVETRASASLFTEYQQSTDPARSYVANNVLGQAIFLADRLHTPAYGRVSVPAWSPVDRRIERRAVNSDRFSPSVTPATAFDHTTDHVLTVGRVSKKKGSDLLIDISAALDNVEFSVVGPLHDEELVKRLRARPNVTLHGEIAYVDMPRVYTGSDLLLSVSRVEWGGVSRAMLEARATETPVVALDIEDASAVADHVVEPDPGAIEECVRSVLDR